MTRFHTNHSRKRRSGFTMMEALIALVLLFLAILGMGGLAGTTVRSNMTAQDRTQATFLAERLLNTIRIEGMAWNDTTWAPSADTGTQDDTYMKLLRPLPVNGTTGFMELTQELTGAAPKAYTPDLKMVDPTADGAFYCAHYNLTWKQPNETIEAVVRVYWMRRGANPALYNFYTNCGSTKINQMGNSAADLKCVTATGLISRYEDV